MISQASSSTVTLRPADNKFWIQDRFTVTGRASIELSKNCPREYKMIIAECINRGWIKPVANISERELLFSVLSDERTY